MALPEDILLQIHASVPPWVSPQRWGEQFSVVGIKLSILEHSLNVHRAHRHWDHQKCPPTVPIMPPLLKTPKQKPWIRSFKHQSQGF